MKQSEGNEKNWLFIVNPAAGSGKVGKNWPAIEQQLRTAGIHFDAVFTKKKLHATFLAAQAIEQGYTKLVAVGGDGTGNEVVNGIFGQTACPPEMITFTMLPGGTGNDWIKTYRIPKKTKLWVRYFKNATCSFQDVGWLTFQQDGREQKRYFHNVVGLSYDAYVATRAEGNKMAVSNAVLYLFFVLRCLFEFKIPRIRLEYDGQVLEDKLYTINAGVCRYSGGGLQLVPQAIPNDGKLALTYARRIARLEVVLFIVPLFYSGKIGWHPAVKLLQAEEIAVDSLEDQPVLAEADGEPLGSTPVRIGILKNKLKILVPARI